MISTIYRALIKLYQKQFKLLTFFPQVLKFKQAHVLNHPRGYDPEFQVFRKI